MKYWESRLRNGMRALIHQCMPPVGVFTLEGQDQDGQPHLWRQDGRWRERGGDHGFDVVGTQPVNQHQAASQHS